MRCPWDYLLGTGIDSKCPVFRYRACKAGERSRVAASALQEAGSTRQRMWRCIKMSINIHSSARHDMPVPGVSSGAQYAGPS
jgi:hypothetical protein